MIFKTETKAMADKALNELKGKLSGDAKAWLFAPHRYDRWIELLTERMNQVEMFVIGQGKVPTRRMMQQFAHKAAIAYVKVQTKYCFGKNWDKVNYNNPFMDRKDQPSDTVE